MRGTAVQKPGTSVAQWGVIGDAHVQRVARAVARSIADMNQGVLEEDDLYQEGLVLIAATPHIARQATTREYGLLYTRLRTELMQKFVEKLDRSGELAARKYRSITIEDAEIEPLPPILFDDGSGDYTEDAVKLLMPAVWDESYAYGIPLRDDAPDKDMPKGPGNKARSNSHWAYIADIKTGWEKTPLTHLERRALLMAYGLGWTQTNIANYEGVAQKTISVRLSGATKKIAARLNGAAFVDEEDS